MTSKEANTATVSAPPSASAAEGSASGSGAGAEPTNLSASGPSLAGPSANETVLEYLKKRGYTKAEAALRAELYGGVRVEGADGEVGAGPRTMGLTDLASKSAPQANLPSSESLLDTYKDGPGATAAANALLLDPTDRARGWSALEKWIEGSLDIYRPQLRPVLLPLFIHAYIDLVDLGLREAASAFFQGHAGQFAPTHQALLAHLSAVQLPFHVQSDEIVQRFRNEKYVIKMTKTVLDLLMGWLTDGVGPVAGAGAAESIEENGVGVGEAGRRGRKVILGILNERVQMKVLSIRPTALDLAMLEEGTGLTALGPSHIVTSSGARAYTGVATDPDAFNARVPGQTLRLGPAPMNQKLKDEVERALRDDERREKATEAAGEKAAQDDGASAEGREAVTQMEGVESTGEPKEGEKEGAKEGEPSVKPEPSDSADEGRASQPPGETSSASPAPTSEAAHLGLTAPLPSDMLPLPSSFRNVDVRREVEKVRDARKRIRLDPGLLEGGEIAQGLDTGGKGVVAALPSVCQYTFHDAGDGLCCATFSDDVSLIAGGFSESYIQLWSLKGDRLRGLRSDFNMQNVRDAKSLRKYREKDGSTTRRLVGHSGPVYGVSFDPLGGSATSPRHLLSCSQDGTTRLWSLDTMSSLVVYRGHQDPVWDVQWGPMGVYFATGSRDRTARLWSTERVAPLRMFAGHLSDVECLKFHPNSLYLATGSADRTCRLWDVQRGTCVRLFVGHTGAITALAVSSDGRYLASASEDLSINLWDLGSGRRVKKMTGHARSIYSLAFSAESSLLVSGSADCTVRCWDVGTAGGERRGSGHGHEGTLNEAAAGLGAAGSAIPFSKRSQQANADEPAPSNDLLATFRTKRTPIVNVHFTPRNLCLSAGAMDPEGVM